MPPNLADKRGRTTHIEHLKGILGELARLGRCVDDFQVIRNDLIRADLWPFTWDFEDKKEGSLVRACR